MIGGLERGLTFEDVKQLEIGDIIDFCVDYNTVHDKAQIEENKPTKRKATQADWDGFWG